MPAARHELRLAEVSALIVERTGLYFPPERWRDLERNLAQAAAGLGFTNSAACVEWLLKSDLSDLDIEALAGHLTIGETYFFRDARLFRALETQVLPDLIRQRRATRRLRIWSAGCCTGEEPYSIAMLLQRLVPDLREWNISILATDINRVFLEKAAKAMYGEWSFRETPQFARDLYFARKGSQYEVLPHIRPLVNFASLNLVQDVYPSLVNNTSGIDLILCRNVLMYFEPSRTREAVKRLQGCLVEGGWLVPSPSEASSELFAPFAPVEIDGAILYQKTKDGARRSYTARHADVPAAPPQWDARPVALPSEPLAIPEPYVNASGPVAEEAVGGLEVGRRLYAQGRYDEAIAALRTSDGECLRLLARIAANQGKLDEALASTGKAIELDRGNPCNYYLRAVILREQGKAAEAAAALRQTVYLEAGFVVAHFALADLARGRGALGEARRHWRNALELLSSEAEDTVVPEAEGLTAGRLREIVESAQALEKAV